jgi:hypothetical protein
MSLDGFMFSIIRAASAWTFSACSNIAIKGKTIWLTRPEQPFPCQARLAAPQSSYISPQQGYFPGTRHIMWLSKAIMDFAEELKVHLEFPIAK